MGERSGGFFRSQILVGRGLSKMRLLLILLAFGLVAAMGVGTAAAETITETPADSDSNDTGCEGHGSYYECCVDAVVTERCYIIG